MREEFIDDTLVALYRLLDGTMNKEKRCFADTSFHDSFLELYEH